ncbi:pyrolysin [Artomyces pyxidatus]|uniref:Pyrolysin n=1 Tax=Artomyces pyxidatus TaxID=48021 RepID=A0ACB8T3X3_9AGAM|nr:pyrolysin [Artomyces pyxidatus]
MKTAFALVPLILIGSAVAVVPFSNLNRTASIPFVQNRFIVEVENPSDIPGKRSLHSPTAHLFRSLEKRGVGFNVERTFNSPGIFVGASVSLSDPSDVSELINTPGVVAIRPVKIFQAPNPVKVHVVTGLDDPQIPPDSESTHILTGVDKLHAQGIFGAGINIGIIDTGIDYTHPALGGGFGPGYKVVGGYDFVGDAYNGSNSPVPDDDPLDQCNGHGTHVGGIIGADPDNMFNISGVAYESSLTSYRIFGCTGSTTDDIIVDALLRGFSDDLDILTLSLGEVDGWTEDTTSVVASRIAASGKVVTVAAGNDGAIGSWFTSGPSNGINVISVASSDNTVIMLQNATVQGVDYGGITYYDLFPLPIPGIWPIYATSNDTTIVDDACDALPDDTPDLSSFLTVVRRGTCTFVQKLTNIAAKGGNVALIYDNGNGFTAIDTGNFTNVTLIQAADGEFLVSQYVAGKNVSISFPQSGASTGYPDPSGGLISNYTSYGPTNDFHFKPAVTAPGGNILSTYPVPLGSFAVESGTSMATPFIAGSAALVLSVKGNSSAVGVDVRTLLETTAQTISSSHTDGDPLQTATQQGAGLVDVFTAIHSETLLSPGELILNDTAHYKGEQTFTVQNIANTTKSYTLDHFPAGTAISVTPGTIFPADGPVPLTSQYATVKLSESAFTLGPGETKNITANISPPAGVDASTFPVFSGYIQVTSNTERTHVSYLGLAASLKNIEVLDNTNYTLNITLPTLIDTTGNPQTAPTNYTFNGTDWPLGILRLSFGTVILRVDLVEANINFNGTLNTRALDQLNILDKNWFTFPRGNGSSFAQVAIVGPLLEEDLLPRNAAGDYSTIGFAPEFANGTDIPNGSYRILIRALKVTGDPSLEADFESWLSPIVGFNVSAGSVQQF